MLINERTYTPPLKTFVLRAKRDLGAGLQEKFSKPRPFLCLKMQLPNLSLVRRTWNFDSSWLRVEKDDLGNLYILKEENEVRGLNMNMKKPKIMLFSKNKIPPTCKTTLDDEELQQAGIFKYLGSILTMTKCKGKKGLF